MFVEVVYETGRHSVMQVEDEAEALLAMGEQHRRAKAGELNGPQQFPAERVVRAFTYAEHPDNYNPADTLTADEVKKALPDILKKLQDENGVVPVGVLATEVRDLTHPMHRGADIHGTIFKMEETGEISNEQIELASEELANG